MAGEFVPDPPKSGDAQARKLMRLHEGKIKAAPNSKTTSNGAVGASISGRRVQSGAARVRGGKL